jgi:hypothetical protein
MRDALIALARILAALEAARLKLSALSTATVDSLVGEIETAAPQGPAVPVKAGRMGAVWQRMMAGLGGSSPAALTKAH